LVSTWLIILPDPDDAPPMLPVTVPIVHAKVLGAVAPSVILGELPLQIATAGGLVTSGVGFTVTTILYGVPTLLHPPTVVVGVMIYSTVPADALPGFTNISLIWLPEPAVAPVIPPVMVPTVHVNVLGAEAVSEMFGLVLLQIEVVEGLVTVGRGFTVTMIE
jgi:hypothetical protein